MLEVLEVRLAALHSLAPNWHFPHLRRGRRCRRPTPCSNKWLRAYTIAGTYEQLVFYSSPLYAYAFADCWIFDPSGRFFLRKGYLDDLRNDDPGLRGQIFDPVVQLLRVSEAFVVGSIFAVTLGYDEHTQLRFEICWGGLKGRTLPSKIRPEDDFWSAEECQAEEVRVYLTLPIKASEQEVIEKTTEAIQQLARAFGGYTFSQIAVQKEVTQQLSRR